MSRQNPAEEPQKGRRRAALCDAQRGQEKLWSTTVTPLQSLICETPATFQGASEGVAEVFTDGDLGALAVDTLAVTMAVGPEVIQRLADLAGRRVFIGPGNVFEGDSVRIGNIPGTYDPNLWIQPFSENELAPTRIKIEGSAHRHILGHNIKGGPMSVVASARYLISQAEAWLGVLLPAWPEWKLTRVDLTEVYDCGSEDGAHEAWKGLAEGIRQSTAVKDYPRNYGSTVYAGRGFKAYLKSAEVRKHRPAWCDTAHHLQFIHEASNLVRLETTYRQQHITRLTEASLGSLDERPLKEAARRRIARYTRLGIQGMETVRTIEEVTNRLQSLYAPQTAASVLGTWFRLTTLGESGTRKLLTKPTYYRHLKLLRDAAISWQGTDVMRIELKSALPKGFCFSPTSPWAVRGEDPRVTAALAAA